MVVSPTDKGEIRIIRPICQSSLLFLVSVHPEMRIFGQDQGMQKNKHRHLLDIPSIIFFHNTEIGQKDHFWMDTI